MGRYTNKKLAIERDKIDEARGHVTVSDEYGLCSRCDNFKIRKSKLYNEEVWCDNYNSIKEMTVKPSKMDPVVECSSFYPRGQLNLRSMLGIATIIDVEEKRVAGFAPTTERTVSIKPPDDSKEDEESSWEL